MNIKKKINETINGKNDYIIGYADLTGLLLDKYQGYNYAVVMGRKLDDTVINGLENGPTHAYYDHYNLINDELALMVNKIALVLDDMNIDVIKIKPTLKDKELDEDQRKALRYDFSHKMAATRAGLGWIGKTDLFISHEFGPRLRLAAILINHPVSSDNPPINKSKCGDCRLCVAFCTAGAATGQLWDINTDRDEFFDAWKCKKACREISLKNINKNISICGKCIYICPIGRKNKF